MRRTSGAGGERHHALRRTRRSVDMVTRALREYADRGVFRGFSARTRRDGRELYTFTWLTPRPMRVVFDPGTDDLSVRDLFPDVDPRSAMVSELKRLVGERSSRELPAHKRLDRRKAALACAVRGGSFGVRLGARGSSHDYAVRYLMNLVNDLYLRLHEVCPEYLITQFGLSSE